MTFTHLVVRRLYHAADVHTFGATGVEFAALRRICGRRNIAGKNYAVHLDVRVGHGHCGEQRFGVRVHRIVKDFVCVAEFHHVAEVHDQNLVGNVLDNRQVVRNKDVGKPHSLLQFFQKVDYLRLNGHVERGNGLVADDKLRLDGKCARDTNTLALTARKLVRIAVVILRLQTAFLHRVENVVVHLLFGYDMMHFDRFGNYIADGHSGRKRRVRVLENQLNIGAILAHFAALKVGYVVALEENLAAVRLVKLEYRSPQRCFAAAGLADYADSRAGFYGKADVVHGFEVNQRLTEHRFLYRKVFL